MKTSGDDNEEATVKHPSLHIFSEFYEAKCTTAGIYLNETRNSIKQEQMCFANSDYNSSNDAPPPPRTAPSAPPCC